MRRTLTPHTRGRSYRFVVAVIVAVAVPAGTAAAVNVGRDDVQPRITTTGLTTEQQQLVTWALALYAEARLPLPPIDFLHSDVPASCLGRRAAHRFADGRSTITLCTREAGPSEQSLFLHEVAHAWQRVGLRDADRQAFLDLRQLATWQGTDPTGEDWHQRGAEHAAEIMTWALMDRPMRVAYIPDRTCAQLLTGYRTLTGHAPLHGYTDYC